MKGEHSGKRELLVAWAGGKCQAPYFISSRSHSILSYFFHILSSQQLGYILQFMTRYSLVESVSPPHTFLVEHKMMVYLTTNGALDLVKYGYLFLA